ncbi:uncharacterized protein K444DRAFT_167668 [Hyaloscypha bicolor E]|uniref:Uncharacterized protein n=1 Tax=Hyaloscypha bicolor E TaxID=1095630 RepID=A0A2J6TTG2_9HELO|nr:uncharacterized protein K444DRAFT_167668 [Hyaloscypha bicolor E]PMD66258.1 hypothetical protein K444DRAFT_167668 [Hyaloscypha bicolor E]
MGRNFLTNSDVSITGLIPLYSIFSLALLAFLSSARKDRTTNIYNVKKATPNNLLKCIEEQNQPQGARLLSPKCGEESTCLVRSYHIESH